MVISKIVFIDSKSNTGIFLVIVKIIFGELNVGALIFSRFILEN